MDSTSISTLAKFILPHCLFWNYPTEREESINVSLHKGKCTALERGNYKGHEFSREGGWEHPTTTMGISNIKFGFTPERNTTDAIFIVRQLQNRFHAVNKTPYVAFVYLEKSFECVPRYVNLWAHRRFDVEECLVQPIQSKHENVMSRLYVGRNLRGDFRVKIGVHQGFFPDFLLFITVLWALFHEFCIQCPCKSMIAEDQVIITESQEELQQKLILWKTNMEGKGLRVNMSKPRSWYLGSGLICRCLTSSPVPYISMASAQTQFSVVVVPVWSQEMQWYLWHSEALKPDPSFKCERCTGQARPVDDRPMADVTVVREKLEVMSSICYPGVC